jgi:hypothetical protein
LDRCKKQLFFRLNMFSWTQRAAGEDVDFLQGKFDAMQRAEAKDSRRLSDSALKPANRAGQTMKIREGTTFDAGILFSQHAR